MKPERANPKPTVKLNPASTTVSHQFDGDEVRRILEDHALKLAGVPTDATRSRASLIPCPPLISVSVAVAVEGDYTTVRGGPKPVTKLGQLARLMGEVTDDELQGAGFGPSRVAHFRTVCVLLGGKPDQPAGPDYVLSRDVRVRALEVLNRGAEARPRSARRVLELPHAAEVLPLSALRDLEDIAGGRNLVRRSSAVGDLRALLGVNQ